MKTIHPLRHPARRAATWWFALVGAAMLAPAAATDIANGKAKAQACAVCHGANGISQMPNAPHLAGQPAIYLAEQLKRYRSGQRQHEIMSVIAKPLTDDDIAALAAWFESIKIQVATP